jgi:hypothetical protein
VIAKTEGRYIDLPEKFIPEIIESRETLGNYKRSDKLDKKSRISNVSKNHCRKIRPSVKQENEQ